MARKSGYDTGQQGIQNILLEKEKKKLEVSKQSYVKKIENLIAQIKDLKQERQTLDGIIKLMHKDKDMLKTKIDGEIKELVDERHSKIKQLEKLDADISEKQAELGRKRDVITNELKQYEARLKQREKRQDNRAESLRSESVALRKVKDILDRKDRQIEKSIAESDKIAQKVQADRAELKQEGQRLSERKTELLDLESKVKNEQLKLEDKIKVLNKGIEENKNLIATFKDLEKIKAGLEKKEKDLQVKIKDNNEKSKQLLTLDEDLEMKEKALAKREQKIRQKESYLKEGQNG